MKLIEAAVFFFIDFHLTSFQPSFDSKKSFCAKKFRTDCVTLLKKSSSPAPFFYVRAISRRLIEMESFNQETDAFLAEKKFSGFR